MSCVGKTTIGSMLAEKIGFTFLDIDEMIQEFYQKPIERIQEECLTMYEFRKRGSIVLDQILTRYIDSVVSGTPAGLKFSYLNVYKRHKQDKALYSIHLYDSFEHVVNRLVFYDKDSNRIIEHMDEAKRRRYLHEIKSDYNYFAGSYKKADFQINIEQVKLEDIPNLIIEELRQRNIIPQSAVQL
ncbi:MAG: shikimate kinase [Sphaerochaetaceae bacterium]|nr:shikimate kinase [Sphaerochaetaceae bacterium]